MFLLNLVGNGNSYIMYTLLIADSTPMISENMNVVTVAEVIKFCCLVTLIWLFELWNKTMLFFIPN